MNISLVYREHSQIIFFVKWLSSFLAGDAVAAMAVSSRVWSSLAMLWSHGNCGVNSMYIQCVCVLTAQQTVHC